MNLIFFISIFMYAINHIITKRQTVVRSSTSNVHRRGTQRQVLKDHLRLRLNALRALNSSNPPNPFKPPSST